MKNKIILILGLILGLTSPAATTIPPTLVMFPLNTMFGGAAVNKPMQISAVNTVVTDGLNVWASSFQNVPASLTNPIVPLYPNDYIVTIAGVTQPFRLRVPRSTNVLSAAGMIPGGTLLYLSTAGGIANLYPTNGVFFITNADNSSIGIGANGGGGGSSGLWTTGAGFVYPSGSSGSDTSWTATGGSIFPN